MLETFWNGLWSPFDTVAALFHAGEWIIWWIFAACVAMWTVIFERHWYFKYELAGDAARALQVWNARKDHKSWHSRHIRNLLISRLNAAMNANISILRVLVPLCPLLGLVGTVSGMLEVFDAMAARGSADAKTMAAGVSQAMLATMTGLAVSVSGMFPLYRFQNRVRLETELLADKFQY